MSPDEVNDPIIANPIGPIFLQIPPLKHQTSCRVHRRPVLPDLEVEVGAGGAAGGSHTSDRITGTDDLAAGHRNSMEMAVSGGQPTSVIDGNQPAATAGPSSKDHRS